MSESQGDRATAPDVQRMSEIMARISERSQKLVQEFAARQGDPPGQEFQVLDPGVMAKTFADAYLAMARDPTQLIDAQLRFWRDYGQLWSSAARGMLDQDAQPSVIDTRPGDRRFHDDEWDENPVFSFIKQSYLLASRFVNDCTAGANELDEHTAHKLDFYARQFVDAMAPTNFASTNPAVVRETLATGGENLLKGLENMLEDLERGHGKLRVRMTDLERFKLGENIAVTPGKVIFSNDLMQLIQYAPSSEKVHRRPLLIIPPWINKFYILDLRPKNSFIKWAIDEGHTVFVISWVNPDEKLAQKRFDDYMLEGPLAALDAIEQATGEKSVKAIGYCLGGTLLAATLAYMKAKRDRRIKCATFFTTMVDFAEPGELGVFIDEEQLSLMEKEMADKGYFEGAKMADAFNLLRANDLIWSFVVNNYLLGRDPFPFDLLYWNSDSTRMPREMHSYYLRNMYQRNLLSEPAALEVNSVKIDLTSVDVPVYILSTREDHIAPWKSTYVATRLYSGDIRFVLGASGHIAGVVNPPSAGKYGYWTGSELVDDPQQWLDAATYHAGSWWQDWSQWVSAYNGKQVPARDPGTGKLAVIEDAPGSYVKVRID